MTFPVGAGDTIRAGGDNNMDTRITALETAQGTPWTSYTPTLTTTAGTWAEGTGGGALKQAAYRLYADESGNDMLDLDFHFIQGSSGGSVGTNPTFSLPAGVTILDSATWSDRPASQPGVLLIDSTGGARPGYWQAVGSSATTIRITYLNYTTGFIASITSTAPWNWANPDEIRVWIRGLRVTV